jgi:hypothetical protein
LIVPSKVLALSNVRREDVIKTDARTREMLFGNCRWVGNLAAGVSAGLSPKGLDKAERK